jgi:hypothetical protein
MTDGHYERYQEMLDRVDWDRYGVVDGVARDPRCEHCMVHCGYDPSGALGTNYQRGDHWKNFKYNFWPRPKPYLEGRKVKAFNGFSVGKGHLAEAKAAIQNHTAAPKSMFHHEEGSGGRSGCCGNGDTSQRDGLLAKIQTAKKLT